MMEVAVSAIDMMPFRHDYYTYLYIVVSNIAVLVIATFGQFGVSDPGNWFDSSVNLKELPP